MKTVIVIIVISSIIIAAAVAATAVTCREIPMPMFVMVVQKHFSCVRLTDSLHLLIESVAIVLYNNSNNESDIKNENN